VPQVQDQSHDRHHQRHSQQQSPKPPEEAKPSEGQHQIFGQPDFSLKIDIGDSAITYGNFLNALITFLIVAFVMFLIVKAYNRVTQPKAATTKSCPFCQTDIAIGTTRCPNCTSQLEGVS
jgi:hypothetical protein